MKCEQVGSTTLYNPGTFVLHVYLVTSVYNEKYVHCTIEYYFDACVNCPKSICGHKHTRTGSA